MLSGRLRVLYLHGFASSPGSRKAQFFAAKLAQAGVQLEIPDLAEGRFERLTITGQLKVVERVLRGEPAVLIGSSLGGYLAALYAAKHPEVEKLVLLAPAFGFRQLWEQELGAERFSLWRREGLLPIFHYAEGREVPLAFDLMEDALRYDPTPDFEQPVLIFHGTEDRVVPVQYSLMFANRHANARVVQLPSGHELTDVLDRIWSEMCAFVSNPPLTNAVLD